MMSPMYNLYLQLMQYQHFNIVDLRGLDLARPKGKWVSSCESSFDVCLFKKEKALVPGGSADFPLRGG